MTSPADHARRIITTVAPHQLAIDDVVHAMIDDDVSSLTLDERETYDVDLYAEQYRPVVERVLVIEGIAKHAKHLRVAMTHVTRDDEYLSVLASRVTRAISDGEHRLANLRELAKQIERVESGDLP